VASHSQLLNFALQQLSQLAAAEGGGPKTTFIGIVKEREDNGILEFYDNYFRFPLFLDPKWNVYKALGARKITRAQSLIKILK
jgi:hypothetical protein